VLIPSRRSAPARGSTRPITCGEHNCVGAGLLAKTWCLSMTMVDMPASSRASALLQGIQHPDHLRRPRFRRSRLAGEGVVSVNADVECAGLFAGKRAPTSDQHPDLLRQTTSVGAGLLAKALCLAITMVGVPASSRASATTRDSILPSLAANTRSFHKSASLKCRAASSCVMPSLIGQQRLNL
jgi:hypothetical protein